MAAVGAWARMEVVEPAVGFANASVAVVGVPESLRLVGTFGATAGDVERRARHRAAARPGPAQVLSMGREGQ